MPLNYPSSLKDLLDAAPGRPSDKPPRAGTIQDTSIQEERFFRSIPNEAEDPMNTSEFGERMLGDYTLEGREQVTEDDYFEYEAGRPWSSAVQHPDNAEPELPLESPPATNPSKTKEPKSSKERGEAEFAGDVLKGRYEFLRYLGRGSYGWVAKVRPIKRMKGSGEPTSDDGVVYAVKKVKDVFYNPVEAKRLWREISILRMMRSRGLRNNGNIIELVDIIPPDNLQTYKDLPLVFEFMDTDLEQIFNTKQFFEQLHVTCIMYQICMGVYHLHEAGIVHRDLKPANILINADCSIKICDFGLARFLEESSGLPQSPRMAAMKGTKSRVPYLTAEDKYAQDKYKSGSPSAGVPITPNANVMDIPALRTPDMVAAISKQLEKDVEEMELPDCPQTRPRAVTQHVVTRWYRAPEVILQNLTIDNLEKIDMWSIGCIFAELLDMVQTNCPDVNLRGPMFPGQSCYPLSPRNALTDVHSLDQLSVIFNVVGTPTAEDIQDTMRPEMPAYKFLLKVMSRCHNNPEAVSATDIAGRLQKMFPASKESGSLEIVENLLQFNFTNRMSCREMLRHKYFEDVMDPDDFPLPRMGKPFCLKHRPETYSEVRKLIAKEMEFWN